MFFADEKMPDSGRLIAHSPSLPMKGRGGTMTHDYKRNGTTTLFAALDRLKGEVIGRCMPQHRHQEFLEVSQTIDRSTQTSGHSLHCRQLRNPQKTGSQGLVCQTPALPSSLYSNFVVVASNLVERWFGKITTERIHRGVFTSVPQLERAIYDYIEHNNANPVLVWDKVCQISSSRSIVAGPL